jgi:hypothetical protein
MEVERRFGKSYCLQLQDRRVSISSNQQTEAASFMPISCLTYSSTLILSASFHPTTRGHILQDNFIHCSKFSIRIEMTINTTKLYVILIIIMDIIIELT